MSIRDFILYFHVPGLRLRPLDDVFIITVVESLDSTACSDGAGLTIVDLRAETLESCGPSRSGLTGDPSPQACDNMFFYSARLPCMSTWKHTFRVMSILG